MLKVFNEGTCERMRKNSTQENSTLDLENDRGSRGDDESGNEEVRSHIK